MKFITSSKLKLSEYLQQWIGIISTKFIKEAFFPGPRVTMPHISFRDMGEQVELATGAVNERFDTIEPAIYNNGL